LDDQVREIVLIKCLSTLTRAYTSHSSCYRWSYPSLA